MRKKGNKMPEIWKNKRSETGKRNANLKHYYVFVCIIIFYKCTKHQFIHLLTATCNE